MSHNHNFNLRDIKKNIENVRIDNLIEAVEGAELHVSDDKTKHSQAKLLVDVQTLNAEEMSLLRDSAPLPAYAGGKFSATYRMGKVFMDENKDNMQELLVGKLVKAVNSTYEARIEQANEGVQLRDSKLPAPKEEGFFARLVGSFSSKPKPVHQESSMGMR
jgi:hypothetical protein